MKNQSLIEAAAQVAHEVNRAYCRFNGDESQLPWDAAPAWQKHSCLLGAAAILTNPDLTSRQSHEGWMRQKEADGWVYGPVKDVEKKQHPAFLPYDELPPEQRVKDSLFGAAVRAVFAISPLLEAVTSR